MSSLLEFANKHLGDVKGCGSENVLTRCPFHQGTGPVKTPPFSFSVTKGVWNCFSCNEKGNLYQLITRLRLNPDLFQEELTEARKSSSDPAKYDPLRPGAVVRVEDTIPERILGEFDMCPETLVEDDHFSERTLQRFGIGFDQKHARITFPLRDLTGCLVGISGRTVVDETPRYKVYTHEYAEFGIPPGVHVPKGAILWNADRVYPAACFGPLDTPLVVVEGFKACMRVWDSGYENVVALLGCRMTADQLWILQRIGAPVVLMLDRNEAGKKGTEVVGSELLKYLEVAVAQDYDGEQPSDLDESQVVTAVQNAQSFLTWKFSR
jgi:DNA primase